MVRYIVSIRHFLTLPSVNKILFDTFRHFSPAGARGQGEDRALEARGAS